MLPRNTFPLLKPEIRDAALGNVGTLITFRVSYDEARVLAKYLYPTFSAEQITSLPNHYIFLAMMINGTVSIPFSAKTIRYRDTPHWKSIDNNS